MNQAKSRNSEVAVPLGNTGPGVRAEMDGDLRRRLQWFGGWVGLLLVLFAWPLWELAKLAKADLHSHTVLVPVIVGYLVWNDRGRLSGGGGGSVGWALGFGLLGAGLALLGVGWVWDPRVLGPEGAVTLQMLALGTLVVAGGLAIFGTATMRAVAFPAAFFVFMAPLPLHVADWLEDGLKLASAEVTAWFFEWAGIPFLRDGTLFRLPVITLEVARECSGIRSSYVLLMTSLVAVHLFLRSPWRQALLVGLVIPLGIVRNAFRILVLGWLCVNYGREMIHTWIHHRGGPVFFLLSLGPLFLLLWWLRRGEERARGAGGEPRSGGNPMRDGGSTERGDFAS